MAVEKGYANSYSIEVASEEVDVDENDKWWCLSRCELPHLQRNRVLLQVTHTKEKEWMREVKPHPLFFSYAMGEGICDLHVCQ